MHNCARLWWKIEGIAQTTIGQHSVFDVSKTGCTAPEPWRQTSFWSSLGYWLGLCIFCTWGGGESTNRNIVDFGYSHQVTIITQKKLWELKLCHLCGIDQFLSFTTKPHLKSLPGFCRGSYPSAMDSNSSRRSSSGGTIAHTGLSWLRERRKLWSSAGHLAWWPFSPRSLSRGTNADWYNDICKKRNLSIWGKWTWCIFREMLKLLYYIKWPPCLNIQFIQI